MPDRATTPLTGTTHGDALADAFYNWELRGRGWQRWPYAVDIEPPFRPVRFPAMLGEAELSAWEEPWADAALAQSPFLHLAAAVAAKGPCLGEAIFAAVGTSARPARPLACELVATNQSVRAQITLAQDDLACLPDALRAAASRGAPRADLFETLAPQNETAVVQIALAAECVIPLVQSGGTVPVQRILALTGTLAPDEAAAMQLLVLPASEPWASEMLRAVLGPSQEGLFLDDQDLSVPCREKITGPLFAAVLRVAGSAPAAARAQAVAQQMAQAFTAAYEASANALIVLDAAASGRDELMARLSRCSGMLLNAAELSALLAPSPDPRPPRSALVSPAAGDERAGIGINVRTGETIRLAEAERLKHIEVTGSAPGILVTLALHDLEHRNGVGILDTRGDFYEAVLRRLPSHRLADVALLDPLESAPPLDLLNAASPRDRAALASDLAAVFGRGAAGWSGRSDALFRVALERLGEGASLTDLRRLFARATLDPVLLPGYAAEAAAPVLRRLDQLLDGGAAQEVLAGSGIALDFGRALQGGVFLARAPAGALGEGAARVLAGAILAKFRQALVAGSAAERPPFYLYVNGTDGVFLPAMGDLFALARRGRVGLVLVQDDTVTSIAGTDPFWRGQAWTAIDVPRRGPRAIVQMGGQRVEMDAAAMPVEPPDAFRRAHDARFVSDRRHGLESHAVPASGHDRIARRPIAPADARLRPAFLSTP